MDSREKLDWAISQFEEKQSLIRYADAKAGLILVSAGIFIAAFVNLYKAMSADQVKLVLPFLFFLLSFSAVIIVMLMVLLPRISVAASSFRCQMKLAVKDEDMSLICDTSQDDLAEDYFLQSLELDRILRKKNKYIKVALILLSLSTLPFLVNLYRAL